MATRKPRRPRLLNAPCVVLAVVIAGVLNHAEIDFNTVLVGLFS